MLEYGIKTGKALAFDTSSALRTGRRLSFVRRFLILSAGVCLLNYKRGHERNPETIFEVWAPMLGIELAALVL
jgi:hypothetical protein